MNLKKNYKVNGKIYSFMNETFFFLPKTLSLASASTTLLDPIKLLKLALKVAVKIPTATKGGQMLIGII